MFVNFRIKYKSVNFIVPLTTEKCYLSFCRCSVVRACFSRPHAHRVHNRASAVPRSMHTLPTARCCMRSSKAVRHSWSRYTRPRGGRSSPREMRPSIASMLARLASRSRAFHAPQKTPSTWWHRSGHRHRRLWPCAEQPLVPHPERRGGASRVRSAARPVGGSAVEGGSAPGPRTPGGEGSAPRHQPGGTPGL